MTAAGCFAVVAGRRPYGSKLPDADIGFLELLLPGESGPAIPTEELESTDGLCILGPVGILASLCTWVECTLSPEVDDWGVHCNFWISASFR